MTKGSKMKNTKGNTGNRYSDEQKKEILAFIDSQGRGGISAAQQKYKVSYIAIRSWQDKGFGKAKTLKKVLAQIPAKRGRPANVVSNRPGRPASNAKATSLINKIRSSMQRTETYTERLEKLMA